MRVYKNIAELVGNCRFALYHRLIIANYRLLFFEKTIIFYLPLLFVFCFICTFLSPEFSYPT